MYIVIPLYLIYHFIFLLDTIYKYLLFYTTYHKGFRNKRVNKQAKINKIYI